MSLNDPLANVLSHICNASQKGVKEITTKNNSKIIRKVLELMKNSGYIGDFEEVPYSKIKILKINLIGMINKSGVIKPQYQIKKNDFERFEKRFLPATDFGIIIISTNQGIMTHIEAKEKGLGGKLLSYCY